MKFKNKLTSALLAVSLLGVGSVATSTYANTSATEAQFTVSRYNLTGYTDSSYIKPEVRAKLVTLLQEYTGNNVTVSKLNELRLKLQEVLNADAKGVFTVTLPNQRIADGTVVYNVNFIAGQVNYGSAPGYSQENVRNSLPSLKEGVQFVAGRPWVDERELTMAVENPLKLTQVEYELQPGKPIVANVNVVAPRGKTLRYVSLDNSSTDKGVDYLRFMAGYLNANLTGRDDVLNVVLLTNLKNFDRYFAFGGSYSLPFYAAHQRLDVSLFHSSTNQNDVPYDNSNTIFYDVNGVGDVGILNWSYYLPHFDWAYSNQIKFQAGYTFKRLKSESNIRYNSLNLASSNSVYYISPFNLGFTGKIVPFRGLDIEFSAKYNFFYAGFLGTDNINKLRVDGGRLVTAEKYSDWWTAFVNFKLALPQNWTWVTQVKGQWSNKHLVNSELFSNDVRGFRDSNGSGDSGAYIKNELITPNFVRVPNLDLKGYGFVDAGWVRYNNGPVDYYYNQTKNFDGKNHKVIASTGLGLRTSYKDWSADVYGAYRLKGEDNGRGKFSVWFTTSYRW
ncbi:ShlB/FhaC/HecB family hemolysin secretion/activation protein [Psittacicella gerlachiana]|uniref:Haemolysin activator HlyB C-terminal domain-containing protein n=1 Tax=Psittacicella gerlachiana TaxID=2028574 RepID=A0A3A1YCF9_9GAMM|nr:ShlB/FhaC/HecB family hemolysin secretion/activation protein [Psittacicella gerlachiana]RIY33807.1 hypothetical protein CKF59_06135 [Psittacicella gerlachiana]